MMMNEVQMTTVTTAARRPIVRGERPLVLWWGDGGMG